MPVPARCSFSCAGVPVSSGKVPQCIATARWLTFPDDVTRRNFEREQGAALASDVDGNPVFLASNKYNLQVTMERWPKVAFHATREHGERLLHA